MKNNKSILALIILTLPLAGLIWLTLDLKVKLGELGKLRLEVDKQESQVINMDVLTARYSNYSGLVADWQKRLPKNEEEVAEFAAEMEQIALKNGLELNMSFADLPDRVEVGGRYLWGLEVEFELQGDLAQIERFTQDLAKARFFVRLDKFLFNYKKMEDKPKMLISGVLLMSK